jgi:Tol biopolymer transport system component
MNRTHTHATVAAALLASLVTAAPASAQASCAQVERVSVGADDRQSPLGERFPERPSLSAHGRFVTFVSLSPNLVRGDTNDAADVFVRDRLRGSTTRVSTGPGGEGMEGSGEAVISANGRRVVFTTASALVPADRNETVDVYVRDRRNRRTMLVSRTPDGAAGDGPSFLAHLSYTGRYVTFQSSASDLVEGDTNGVEDAFVRDVLTGVTERVSVLPTGRGEVAAGTEPRITADGSRVLFSSLESDDSTSLWVRDRLRGTTSRVRTGISGHAAVGSWSISGSGRYVAFFTDQALVPADTNGENDVYRVDRWTGERVRLSVGAGGRQGNAYSESVQLSSSGQVAVFSSGSSNLVAGDGNGVVDVFVRDVSAGTTKRISTSSSGVEGDGDSSYSRDLAVSADGRHVAFGSFATNLVAGDTNDQPDVFVWDQACVVWRR